MTEALGAIVKNCKSQPCHGGNKLGARCMQSLFCAKSFNEQGDPGALIESVGCLLPMESG